MGKWKNVVSPHYCPMHHEICLPFLANLKGSQVRYICFIRLKFCNHWGLCQIKVLQSVKFSLDEIIFIWNFFVKNYSQVIFIHGSDGYKMMTFGTISLINFRWSALFKLKKKYWSEIRIVQTKEMWNLIITVMRCPSSVSEQKDQ